MFSKLNWSKTQFDIIIIILSLILLISYINLFSLPQAGISKELSPPTTIPVIETSLANNSRETNFSAKVQLKNPFCRISSTNKTVPPLLLSKTIVPEQIPILEGTIIIGKQHIALIKFENASNYYPEQAYIGNYQICEITLNYVKLHNLDNNSYQTLTLKD